MILNICVIILLIKVCLTNSDVSFQISPASFDLHHQASFNENRLMNINLMKAHIKEILKISQQNHIMDEYIENTFRLDNLNPTYIFVLPGENNRTLVFRRSDFSEMNFPKISTVNKFGNKTFDISSMSNTKIFEQVASEKLTHNLANDDAYDDSIVKQNIQTERNFIKMMNDINDHPESFTKNPISRDGSELKPIAISLKNVPSKGGPSEFEDENHSSDNEWDELGLHGWSGGLHKPKNKDTYIAESPTRTETSISNIQIGKPKNYLSQFSFDTSTEAPKYKTQYHQTQLDHNQRVNSATDTNRQGLSEQLSSILVEERKKIKQKSKKPSQKGIANTIPKFLVTSSRDQHLDEYVFIARANNPFGHSTKLKLSSDSSKTNALSKQISLAKERDGRRKRGVIELYSMIKCGTGCDPLIYKGYGCYCGFLGSGKALDEIDKCCAMHDYCYTVSSCPMFLEYFVPYLWKCYRGRPLCALDHGEWGGPGSCAARLCECDRILAKCLRQYYCPQTRAVCTSSPWRFFQNFIMDFDS